MTKRKIKKIVSMSITIVLSVTLLFMIFVVISSKASGGEPNFLGYQLKTVLSGSMEPTFSTGAVIAVKPLVNTENLQKGDVITFLKSHNEIVTHRISEVVKQGGNVMYQTKGDNNEEADTNMVPSMNVIGKYTGMTIPFLGYFIEFAQSNKGTAMLLIIPGVLLLIYSGVTIWRALKEIEQPANKKDVKETA
ncbi:signal peptidase I SipW [Virgibacillus kekensis]|uniref:Signal peptidase I n=1 Tax=Virgibacillus kekensis TaxID=202261 RepID=A0ABV9DG62_9BACI